MASVRTVTLPDGATFTMSDWGDYQLTSRAEILNTNAQEVTLFNYTVSQELPGGASNGRATVMDTNMPTAGALPLRHQMVVFSIQILFDEAKTNTAAKGLVHNVDESGYQQVFVSEGIRKWNTIKSNIYFNLVVEGTKPYAEGPIDRFPSGGGLDLINSEEAGTPTQSGYCMNNGEPGMHAARRLAMPIHIGALEQFQGIFKFPRGALPNWTDNVAGTKGDFGLTVTLNGPRQRPVG